MLIIGVILLVIGFILLLTDDDAFSFFSGITGAWLLSGAILMMQENNKPSAMDVYQGKTTLEITYKDGVPIDSVVVFKDKKKE
jgi:membrane-bound ClpP family serine protease